MYKKISFKIKVTLPILILGLGLIIVSSVLTYHTRIDMIQAEGLVKATNAILPISSYVHELQKERAKTVLYINKRVSIDELKKQREQVNQFYSSL